MTHLKWVLRIKFPEFLELLIGPRQQLPIEIFACWRNLVGFGVAKEVEFHVISVLTILLLLSQME